MEQVRTRSLFGRAGKAVIVGSHFEIAPCDSVCTGRKMWGIYPLTVQRLFEMHLYPVIRSWDQDLESPDHIYNNCCLKCCGPPYNMPEFCELLHWYWLHSCELYLSPSPPISDAGWSTIVMVALASVRESLLPWLVGTSTVANYKTDKVNKDWNSEKCLGVWYQRRPILAFSLSGPQKPAWSTWQPGPDWF